MAKKSANQRLVRSDFNLLALGLFGIALLLGVQQVFGLTAMPGQAVSQPPQAEQVAPSDQEYALDEPQDSFAEEIDTQEAATPEPTDLPTGY